MKFSMHIPLGEISGGFQSLGSVRSMARALEDGGLDACYLSEHPAPDVAWLHANGHDALDPFTALAFVAASTTRLRVHTNIVVLPYRNPFVTAKAAATLHTLSDGRLILGVAAGYQRGEFAALGVDHRRRGALTDEALDVLRLAWSGGPVVYEGADFVAAGNEPRPALDPHPPVWIGGGSLRAVERAVRIGDGWSPFLAAPTTSVDNQRAAIHSVEELADRIDTLHELRAAADRQGPFDIVLDLGGQLHPGDQTRQEAERFLDLVSRLAEIGVTWTCVSPRHTDLAAYLDAVAWWGEEVVARSPGR